MANMQPHVVVWSMMTTAHASNGSYIINNIQEKIQTSIHSIEINQAKILEKIDHIKENVDDLKR